MGHSLCSLAFKCQVANLFLPRKIYAAKLATGTLLTSPREILVFPEQLGKQKKKWGGQYFDGDLVLPFTPTVTSLSCMMYTLWNSTGDFLWEEDEGKERAAGTFTSDLGLPSSAGATSSLVVPRCLSRKKVTINEHMAFPNSTTR